MDYEKTWNLPTLHAALSSRYSTSGSLQQAGDDHSELRSESTMAPISHKIVKKHQI